MTLEALALSHRHSGVVEARHPPTKKKIILLLEQSALDEIISVRLSNETVDGT